MILIFCTGRFFRLHLTLIKTYYMSLNEYKEAIKNLVDATNSETLLKHWKKQLEWDVENPNEVELSDEEWSFVQEGITDYEPGK